MSGENSKKSGEIGEKLVKNFFQAIGWNARLQAVTITCNNKTHKTTSDNQKRTHGDDNVFIYNNPFFDNRTDIVHVSVKNNLNGYQTSETGLKSEFKEHLEEANEIIECAQYDETLNTMLTGFPRRKHTEHVGMLVWTSSDTQSHDRDILSVVKNVKSVGEACKKNIYFVDGARIHFILLVVKHAKEIEGTFEFFYPESGSTISNRDERHGSLLPLDLIVADVIPVKATIGAEEILILYVNEPFETECYRRVLSLALDFAGAWPSEIRIGFPDFNNAQHENDVKAAQMPFSSRQKKFVPFSFVYSNLNSLENV